MKNINPNQKNYSSFYTEGISLALHASEIGTRNIRKRLQNIPFSLTKRVLDLACGVSLLGKTFSNNVYAIDANKEAIRFALKNGINAKLGDVEKKIDYPNGYFDVVIASQIIEHLADPDHLILEARRMLKKGGMLIIITPNLASWLNRGLLFFGFQPFFTEVSTTDKTLGIKFTRKFTKVRNTVGHLRVFTLRALRDILELHEFKISKTSGIGFPFFPFPINILDTLFSAIPSFASNIIVIGVKT
jgi:2-polyprenyl-3-methyl-5-hydroxy-6-metoxy-1,4-benzoquinol methylase